MYIYIYMYIHIQYVYIYICIYTIVCKYKNIYTYIIGAMSRNHHQSLFYPMQLSGGTFTRTKNNQTLLGMNPNFAYAKHIRNYQPVWPCTGLPSGDMMEISMGIPWEHDSKYGKMGSTGPPMGIYPANVCSLRGGKSQT